MHYCELSDIEIDSMVSKICSPGFHRNYCNNPADAWSIIFENKISIKYLEHGVWVAEHDVIPFQYGKNPLRAAMTVFLLMQESANVPVNSTGPDLR